MSAASPDTGTAQNPSKAHQELLGCAADQLRRQIGAHLARGVPLKALCGLVSAGRTSGTNCAQPVVAVGERKDLLPEFALAIKALGESPTPGEAKDRDTLCADQQAFAALPFVRRFRRPPPRGAIWVLVVPAAMGDTLPFWP